MKKIISIIFLGLISFCLANPAFAEDSLQQTLGKIPVQNGGRVKPFESFARESVLNITGRTSFEKVPATVLVWQWMAKPDFWAAKHMIPVNEPSLRKRFSSDLKHGRITPVLVLSDMDFLKEISEIQEKQGKKEHLSNSEKKTLELYSRARLFSEIAHGRMPGFIPHPENPETAWLPAEAILSAEGEEILVNFFPKENVQKTKDMLSHFLSRITEEDPRLVAPSASFFASALTELLASRNIVLDRPALHFELFYLKLKPFRIAWVLYLVSVFLWLAGLKKKHLRAAPFFYIFGFVMHSFGFILRMLISGRPPVTNMYESVIWVSWAVILFSLILWLIYKSNHLPMIASLVAVFALIIGDALPTVLDQSISPLVPVLRSNYWLTIHVLTITLGYGAFFLNWGIAHALLYYLSFTSAKKTIESLTEYLYRTLQIGIILLATGTILGGVWASYSWGRFWGWDPKETWALVALLAYLAVLHGRTAGWLDQFGVALSCAFCFLCVLMAWYGVNFVLAAGLHSYGFGGGGLQYVSVVVFIDVILLLFFKRRFRIVK